MFVPAGEPDYRVTYVHDTGDFYVVENRFDTSAEVALLGSVGPGHDEPEVYVHFTDWARRRRPRQAIQLVCRADRILPGTDRPTGRRLRAKQSD